MKWVYGRAVQSSQENDMKCAFFGCRERGKIRCNWGGKYTRSEEILCREHLKELSDKITPQLGAGIMW